MKTLIWPALTLAITLNAHAAEWVFVDFQEQSTTELDIEWWTGNAGDSTYSRLPIGETADFEGPDGVVPFHIEVGAIALHGTNAAQFPPEVTDIPVGGTAKFLYFLHATGWEFGGGPSYQFVLNYEDGSEERLDLISNENSDDWCHHAAEPPDPNSVWGWVMLEGPPCNGSGLINTRWENPKPASRIATIDMVSLGTAAVPIIAGITLGDASLAIAPEGLLATSWSRMKR